MFAGHNLTHPNRHRLCSAGCISTGHSLRAWQVRFPHIFGAMCGLKACSLPSIVLTAQSHRHPPSFGLGTCETRLRPVAVAPNGMPSPSPHAPPCTAAHICTPAFRFSHSAIDPLHVSLLLRGTSINAAFVRSRPLAAGVGVPEDAVTLFLQPVVAVVARKAAVLAPVQKWHR